MKVQSLLLGMIIGGVAGSIATLLSAPASGKQTRQDLSNYKESWKKDIHQLGGNLLEIKNSISVVSEEGKKELTAFIQDVKFLIEEWNRDIEPNQEKIRNELEVMQSTIQELEATLNSQQK